MLRTPVGRGVFVQFLRYNLLSATLVAAVIFVAARPLDAATLRLKDGRTLEGRYAELTSVAENPLAPKTQAGEVALTPILVIDDGLRRTYIHRNQVREIPEQDSSRDVRINIWQPVAERGGAVGRIGQAVRVSPFDEYGRRIYEMRSTEGLLSVVQGITQITPLYTKVQGLMGGSRPIVWDMRLATSSIPRDALNRVLSTAVRRDDLEGRLQVVRLYLQSERYRDAGTELEQILKDFPDRQDLQQDIRQLRQLAARLILREIELRADAGQHQRVRHFLENFPSDGVAGETLAEVRERLDQYAAEDARRKHLLQELEAQVAKIADENGRRLAEDFAKEITNEANAEAIERLASFERLADDNAMSPEQKAALAISGWLVGANQAIDNFQVAVSLAQVRDMVRQYLGEGDAQTRSQLAAELRDMEGATVQRVAEILKLMKPPMAASKQAERGPGLFELSFRGMTGENDGRYLVQLPPEYDPLRHYPAVVVLADAGMTPEQMLDYWAGPVANTPLHPREEQGEGSAAATRPSGERLGQATRHGYIVIAVDWQQPHQLGYGYSDREHHGVLGALRDACRRFAIDTDRVFLTGHGMGGDAAWDIALAHPDLWAGVIPIVATAGRYVERYAKNAPYLNWYVVAGELDGDKMARNAQELDRYMKPNNDVTVVEYLGRGFEPFGDEIQRMFEWMRRRRRTSPTEVDCVSMRPWDNFFWWLEAEGLPEKTMVSPGNWPPGRGVRPARLRGKRLEANKVWVSLQAERVTVWLAPELVDFDQQLVVEVNNRAITPRDRRVEPDLNVLLEDARTRVDRQHPFWAKVSTP